MLFSSPALNGMTLTQQLNDVISATNPGSNQFNGFNIKPDKQEEVSSSPENSPSQNLFPFIDQPIPEDHLAASRSSVIKEKLLTALRGLIPHKSSLTLRLLVTYAVDNGNSDVIVIDETLRRKSPSSPSRTVERDRSPIRGSNALNLSTQEDKPTPPPVSLYPQVPMFDFTSLLGMQNKVDRFAVDPSLLNIFQPISKPSTVQQPPAGLNTDAATFMMLQTLLNPNNRLQQNFHTKPELPVNLPESLVLTQFEKPQSSDSIPNINVSSGSEFNFNFPLRMRENSLTPPGELEKPSSTTSTASSGGGGGINRRYMHPRRFVCNQCRQSFPSLAELNRHTLELHNSFRCNVCQAKFTQRSNLQRHSLKHVGFKPFICNICQKEYYRKDHLVRHIEVTHPNVDPRSNITVRLTSSECLDFLENLNSYSEQTLQPMKQGLIKSSSPILEDENSSERLPKPMNGGEVNEEDSGMHSELPINTSLNNTRDSDFSESALENQEASDVAMMPCPNSFSTNLLPDPPIVREEKEEPATERQELSVENVPMDDFSKGDETVERSTVGG